MTNRLWSWVAAISCLSALPAAAADTATPMALAAQPLTHAREGQVQGCGLRLTGGVAGREASSWFDVSVSVFGAGGGLVQAVVYELRRSDYDGEARPQRVPVRSTWVRVGEGSTRRGENVERRDTLVYRMLAEDALAVFEALAEGRSITVGIRGWDEPEDSVYTGAPVLDEPARAEVGACLGLLKFDRVLNRPENAAQNERGPGYVWPEPRSLSQIDRGK